MKAEIRAAAIFDVGEKIENIAEATRNEAQRLEGKVQGCMEVAAALTHLAKVVDEDVNSGAIPDLATAEHIKRWLTRGVHVAENLARQNTNFRLEAAGRSAALVQTTKVIKEMYDREKAQTPSAVVVPQPPDDGERAAPPSLKEQRLLEEAAQAQAQVGKKTRRRK